ncbi:hypothetical protein [Streptomyces sp. NPDC003952]
MTSQTSTFAWPEGTLFRFVSVGGATVDITQLHDDEPAKAEYLGCLALNTNRYGVTTVLKAWAQTHAEKCRALPRPTA